MKTKLKKGDRLTFKDRLWAIVNADGKIVYASAQVPAIYSTRAAGRRELMEEYGERIVRLDDMSGEVV